MITYIITNDSDISERHKFITEFELDNPFQNALETIGYHLNHDTDDGNTHEYVLIENESGKSVYRFMEYSFYRACFEALSELGYSCDKEDEFMEYDSQKLYPKNKIIPFEI
jgi:hypothetical protein